MAAAAGKERLVSVGKAAVVFISGVYLSGILFSIGVDLWRFWNAGGGDNSFAILESLTYASFWPLRMI